MTKIPSPAIHSPIIRIGGRLQITPPESLLSILHVDGSYRHRDRTAKIGFHLTTAKGQEYYQKIPITASNSTEAEWASIYLGLKASIENEEGLIHIHNDCLSVIHAFLLHSNPPKKLYARHYKEEITTLANQATWVGISWIPRELNRGDQVLQ